MKKLFQRVIVVTIVIAVFISAASMVYASNVAPFTDVSAEAWYAPYVTYVYNNQIMNGTSAICFGPNNTCTRAMATTVIYRMEGSPAVADTTTGFTDLRDSWYMAPVAWAKNNGIVNGVSATTFCPNNQVTREQLVTLLWRYLGEPAPASADKITAFPDYKQVSNFAADALNWAIEAEIISGSNGRLLPKKSATRAELAKILTVFIQVEPKYHVHTWDEGQITTAATCTTTGIMTFTCTRCGATEDRVIPAEHAFGEWTTTKEATCTQEGSEERVCSRCGEIETRIVAIQHNFNEWAVVKAATCTEDGSEKRTCSLCGYVETKTINALGHSYSAWTVVTPATCTESGVESQICAVCGLTNTREINKTEHAFGEWMTVNEATCKQPGMEKRICSKCKMEETRPIDALGHVWSSSNCSTPATCSRCGATNPVSESHSWSEWSDVTAATCTKAGSQTRTCTKCGAVETRETEALGHDWETVLMSDAADKLFSLNDISYCTYTRYTEFSVCQCSRCLAIDESTLRPIYTDLEAAEIALSYVNELREEYFGDTDHDLVIDPMLVELAAKRARDLETIGVTHYHPLNTVTYATAENITASGSNIGAHFRNFFNEPDHKTNMLREDLKYFGYAMYHPDGFDNCAVYCAQLFWNEHARDFYISDFIPMHANTENSGND